MVVIVDTSILDKSMEIIDEHPLNRLIYFFSFVSHTKTILFGPSLVKLTVDLFPKSSGSSFIYIWSGTVS